MAKKSELAVDLKPCYDHNRHTILKIGLEDGVVKYVPLNVVEGLKVCRMKPAEFDKTYKEIPSYPVNRAVDLFVQYAKTLGATKEVLELFKQHTNISEEVMQLSMNKQASRTTDKPSKSTKKVEAEEKPTKLKSTGKKLSAAQMFKDLILEGKLSDDQIFRKVQEAFDLPESKKGYVKWYRNHLKKEGLLKEAEPSKKPENQRTRKTVETGPKPITKKVSH